MKYVVSIIVCISVSISILSQPGSLRFKNLTEKQGLADANIASVIKDHTGYMWFASSEGLNRFDGKTCKVYHHLSTDNSSISSDNINIIFEDSKNNLWIGTRNGLNLYDTLHDNFKRFHYDAKNPFSISSNEIWSIAEDKKGGLWIGTMGGGLNKLLVEKNKNNTVYKFNSFKHDTANAASLSNNIVWSIAFDKQGHGWLGTEYGLNRFVVTDTEDNKISFAHYFHDNNKFSLAHNSIWKIATDENDNVWLLSLYGMLDILPAIRAGKGTSTASFIHVLPMLQSKLHMQQLSVVSFLTDKSDNCWIGTDRSGLVRFKIKIDESTFSAMIEDEELYRHNDLEHESLVNDLVYSLSEEANGNIWAGTANGISVYIPQKKMFDAYSLNSNSELFHNSIRICSYDGKYTWLASNNTIWMVDQNGRTRLFSFFNSSFEVTSLHRLSSGDLLAGIATNGLYLYDNSSIKDFIDGKTKQPVAQKISQPAELAEATIFSISSNKTNQLLLGGYARLGILTSTAFQNYASPGHETGHHIFRCVAEKDSVIYCGTDDGLFIFNKQTGTLLPLQSKTGKLSADRINCMLLLQENLWIGTISGLNVYNINNHTVQSYFIADGLSDNNITALASDKQGNLWIATRNGLCRFNNQDSIFSTFSENEGLNSNQLNALAFCDSVLFVGTDKGVNTLIPSRIMNTNSKRNIIITDFRIAGKSILSAPLSVNGKALKQKQSIQIGWSENNISIQFTALEYTNPDVVKYAFMLDGFDKNWIYNGNNTVANYTNLPGGKYIFKIRYAGNDGIWQQSNISIPLYVSTAWFKAWWFYLICVIGATVLVYTFYRIRLARIIAMQRIRNKIARDLHDDIGSTLSTIKILSGAATKKITTDTLQAEIMLQKITESSGKMMDAMSDIVWSINPENDSLDNMAVRMREYAARILEPKNINYKVTVDETITTTKLSPEKRRDIYLIFKEAVNNIVKYADATETSIGLAVQHNFLELTISDNGKGFDTTTKYTGNGLKNISQRAKNNGGTCQWVSNAGQGTTVYLSVPIT